MSKKYALDFWGETISTDNNPKEIFTLIEGGSDNGNGSLINVSFHKEIYQPGCIEFKVQMGDGNSMSNCKGFVSLKYGQGKSYEVVAKYYYIFERRKTSQYLYCKAYSVDKFLTLDKFNQAFTGKRLVTEIVEPTLTDISTTAFNMFKANVTKSPEDFYVYKNLNHLVYQLSGDVKDEAILPYSTQYDESFYEFLVRICNRNGEFLYCENNEFHIGHKVRKELDTLSWTDNVEETETLFYGNNSVWIPSNYMKDEVNRKKMISNKSVLAEEDFEPIKDEDYASMKDYTPPLATTFDLLKSAEECQNFFDAILATIFKVSMLFGVSGHFMKQTNDGFAKNFSDKNDNIAQYDGDEKYEFSSHKKLVNQEFYKTVLEGEEICEKNVVIWKGTTYTDILLGDIVKNGEKKYVVYSVKGGYDDGTKNESQEVTLLPCDTAIYPLPKCDLHIRKCSPQRAVVTSNVDPERMGRVRVKYPWQYKYTKDDFPNVDEDEKDKAALGQNLLSSTPWLRISYPMASDGAGFMFFPKEGDEVLVDYEDGNIDRPFVVGSFYTDRNRPSVPSATHMMGLTKSITSDNGHHISFTDTPGGGRFLQELIPLASLLSKFSVGTDWGVDEGKFLAGGFEIADYLGVYSIKGSTHGRNISISSPVGDVTIDAFTGITIKAPHGDVNIVGKNVNIEARNNLTIQSGTNIKRPYFWNYNRKGAHKLVGGISAGVVAGVMGVVGLDLSFHRTWLEVLLRPIGGTMQIKSYRFMHLEAGAGEAKFVKNISRISTDGKFSGKHRFSTGMLARHAFQENPLYTADNVKKLVADFNTGFFEFKEICRLIGGINLKINAFLETLEYESEIVYKNQKQSVELQSRIQVNETDFNSYVKEMIDCLNGEKNPITHNELDNIRNDCQAIFRKKNIVKSKLEKLDPKLWDGINDNIDKKLSEIVKGLKEIDYDDDESWMIDVSIYYVSKSVVRSILFELIKKYVDNSDLKYEIIMDDKELENHWDTDDLNIWKRSIRNIQQDPVDSLLKTALDQGGNAFMNKLGFNEFVENDVWGKNHKGRILFSDEVDKTYYLREDGIKVEPQKESIQTIVNIIRKEISNYSIQDDKAFRNAQAGRYR